MRKKTSGSSIFHLCSKQVKSRLAVIRQNCCCFWKVGGKLRSFFLNSLSHQMVQTIGSLFSFGVYYPQCCLDAVKCFSCPKLRNICRERHIVRRLCFSTDQKELPNKRGNLKSSYAEVPAYHSNDSESEGKIM